MTSAERRSTYKKGDLVVEASLHETSDPKDSIDPKHRVLARLGGSCPMTWCKSAGSLALSGGFGRLCQAATAGSLTMGSSLKGAMVSRVM